jgi:hypothetical protein
MHDPVAIAFGVFASVAAIVSTLAQIAGATEAVGPVTSVASIGFAVWFGWYVMTKTMPDKDKYHADVEARQREANAAAINSMLEKFDAITKAQRDECREERQAFFRALDDHNTALDKLTESIGHRGLA